LARRPAPTHTVASTQSRRLPTAAEPVTVRPRETGRAVAGLDQ
jgi:hypothetical protein